MRARFFLFDHLEVTLQSIFDVGRGEISWIDEIGLDKPGWFPRALLDFAEYEQLAGRETVAALDGIDQEPIRLVFLHVIAQHIYPAWQAVIRIATKAIVSKRFQWVIRVMAEAEVIDTANFGSISFVFYYPVVIKHFPEVTKVGPVRRSLYNEANALLLERAFRG